MASIVECQEAQNSEDVMVKYLRAFCSLEFGRFSFCSSFFGRDEVRGGRSFCFVDAPSWLIFFLRMEMGDVN